MRTLYAVGICVIWVTGAAGVGECRPLRWTLQNATLTAGSLSGTFVFDASTATYTDWSITVQGAESFGVTGETFTPANSSIVVANAFFLVVFDSTKNQLLSLSFGGQTATALTDAGGTITLSSIGSWVRNGMNVTDNVFNAAPPLASVTSPGVTPFLSEIGVFRPTSAAPNSLMQWVEDSNGNNTFEAADKTLIFGLSGLPGSTLPDIAVTGDFFGTGASEIGVFRCPAVGQPGVCQWFIDANNNGQWDDIAGGDAIWNFGLPGDLPVVGDWTGSGVAKIGVMRCPANGVCTWYLDIGNKHAYDPATVGTYVFGLSGDRPVISNWAGISQTAPVDNIGIFRCPAAGICTWIVDSVGLTGLSTIVPVDVFSHFDAQYAFGLTGDSPVVGNWNGSGQKRIGVFRPNSPAAGLAQWFVDTNGDHLFELGIDQVFTFGLAGDQPVVGFFTN